MSRLIIQGQLFHYVFRVLIFTSRCVFVTVVDVDDMQVETSRAEAWIDFSGGRQVNLHYTLLIKYYIFLHWHEMTCELQCRKISN